MAQAPGQGQSATNYHSMLSPVRLRVKSTTACAALPSPSREGGRGYRDGGSLREGEARTAG
eukprot:1561150-Rhodomonas_salina.3